MIAIKGAEMPKHCMTCQFHNQMYNRCNIGHFETGAKFIKGNDKWNFKHPNCPLVEIVTCKDCKHWNKELTPRVPDNKEYHFCPMMDCNTSEDFYCADGERRESK